MRWAGLTYRAHDPRWAWAPLSGEGAAVKGGRFNPKGIPALYLALTIEGMFQEMSHGFAHRFEPLTVVTYEIDIDDVVDLRTDADRAAAGVALSDVSCPWAWDVASGRRPASWDLATKLTSAGASGVLVPSFAAGATPHMTDLVLWKWGPDLPKRVTVHDPHGRLPRDMSSWGSP